MDDESRQHLRELHGTLQRRLYVLELQAAQFGISVPPHVVTEIGKIRAELIRVRASLAASTTAAIRAELRQLRQQALKAYYAQQWAQAEDLLRRRAPLRKH
jgi:hypothetical protein